MLVSKCLRLLISANQLSCSSALNDALLMSSFDSCQNLLFGTLTVLKSGVSIEETSPGARCESPACDVRFSVSTNERPVLGRGHICAQLWTALSRTFTLCHYCRWALANLEASSTKSHAVQLLEESHRRRRQSRHWRAELMLTSVPDIRKRTVVEGTLMCWEVGLEI